MAPMGRQWFNLTFREAGELVRGVKHAAPALEAFLDAELKRHNLGPRALALVGFSQGTMMALGVGLKRHPAPAAIVGYSGALATSRRCPREPGSAPAILLVHGDMDEVIPVDAMFIAREQLGAGRARRGVARGARHRPRHRRPGPASRRRLLEAGLRRDRSADPQGSSIGANSRRRGLTGGLRSPRSPGGSLITAALSRGCATLQFYHRGETHDGSSDQEAHAGSTGRTDAKAPRGGKEGGGNAQATGERGQSSRDTGKEQGLTVTPLVADDRVSTDHHQVLNVVHTCGDVLAC